MRSTFSKLCCIYYEWMCTVWSSSFLLWLYTAPFFWQRSHRKNQLLLFTDQSSSICHSDSISDCMFQSHAQVDDKPSLHISIHMRWPDLYSCGWPLALFISTVGKKYHVQQKLNRTAGLLLRKLTYAIGLGLANWLQIITTLSPAMWYQVTTMLTLCYTLRSGIQKSVRCSPRLCLPPYVSWRAGRMGS